MSSVASHLCEKARVIVIPALLGETKRVSLHSKFIVVHPLELPKESSLLQFVEVEPAADGGSSSLKYSPMKFVDWVPAVLPLSKEWPGFGEIESTSAVKAQKVKGSLSPLFLPVHAQGMMKECWVNKFSLQVFRLFLRGVILHIPHQNSSDDSGYASPRVDERLGESVFSHGVGNLGTGLPPEVAHMDPEGLGIWYAEIVCSRLPGFVGELEELAELVPVAKCVGEIMENIPSIGYFEPTR